MVMMSFGETHRLAGIKLHHKNPPAVATGFAGDDAEEIGEKLMSMTLKEIAEIVHYLENK